MNCGLAAFNVGEQCEEQICELEITSLKILKLLSVYSLFHLYCLTYQSSFLSFYQCFLCYILSNNFQTWSPLYFDTQLIALNVFLNDALLLLLLVTFPLFQNTSRNNSSLPLSQRLIPNIYFLNYSLYSLLFLCNLHPSYFPPFIPHYHYASYSHYLLSKSLHFFKEVVVSFLCV